MDDHRFSIVLEGVWKRRVFKQLGGWALLTLASPRPITLAPIDMQVVEIKQDAVFWPVLKICQFGSIPTLYGSQLQNQIKPATPAAVVAWLKNTEIKNMKLIDATANSTRKTKKRDPSVFSKMLPRLACGT